jgi:hypothetical protein
LRVHAHRGRSRPTGAAGLLPSRGLYALGQPRKGLIDPDDPGKGAYDDNPTIGTGAYALDQSWHWWWIFIAALVTALAG